MALKNILLLAATVLALALANSSAHIWYVSLTQLRVFEPLSFWVNDGLMTLFFLVVSRHIQHELLEGELSTRKKALLPVLCAMGGVAVPALLYLLFNHNLETARGWAIPVATDIAFAIGFLSILGSRVPSSLRVFLLALAIVDDLLAILIIALFYGHDYSWVAMIGATAAFAILFRARSRSDMWVATLAGFLLWFCVLKSGIHATLSGVIIGLSLPPEVRTDRLEQAVDYLILPVFAFFNAGVALSQFSVGDVLHSPVFWGVVIGLCLGKPLGIAGFGRLASRLGWVEAPAQTTLQQRLGVGALAGIGFTMSLFLAELSFPDSPELDLAKFGILIASMLAAAMGLLTLWFGSTSSPNRA